MLDFFSAAVIAASAAALAMMLPLGSASTQTPSAAGNGVRASPPGMILTVGPSTIVSAGERRCETISRPQFVAGLCVAAEQRADSCLVGGQSFTARTKVLTATGALVAISKLKAGDKVLATSTKTGKTSAETVAAVLVHRDTDKYELKVKTASGTAVIGTTSSHLFWNATTGRWVKAAALKYGTHLRTPGGGIATALGGWTPRDSSGWMWDLTIPGDHDFYIQAATTAVLVHNCTSAEPGPAPEGSTLEQYANANRGPTNATTPDFVTDYTSPSGARYYGRTEMPSSPISIEPGSALDDALGANLRSTCSEVCALNEAEQAEGPGAIFGGSFRTLRVRSLQSRLESGTPATPCEESCQVLIERLHGSF